MATTFRRGAEAVQAATQGGGSGKFKPIFKFESGETKYLQFLMPMDDIPTVLMHQFIIVGHREDGSPKYERFISRRDPALDGPEGYDELIDRFGSNPSQRSIAVAVELEPVYKQQGTKKVLEGFDIVEREYTTADDETKIVPNVALVIESPYTLYGHLSAYSDLKNIEDVIFAIKTSGKGKDKQYTLMEAGDALDFGDELDEFLEEIDFDGWLEDIADEDFMREKISDLPDGFVVNKYAKGKKGAAKADSEESEKKPARSTRTKRTSVREEVEEPAAEAEDAAEEAGDEPAEPVRKRRFSELRKDMATT